MCMVAWVWMAVVMLSVGEREGEGVGDGRWGVLDAGSAEVVLKGGVGCLHVVGGNGRALSYMCLMVLCIVMSVSNEGKKGRA
jgi:hypothetical protein